MFRFTVAFTLITLLSGLASAQTPITPGNLVLLRANGAGTGRSSVSLLEYTPTGTLVQTINVSGSGADALAINNLVNTNGLLSLSGDGKLVTFAGGRASPGTGVNAAGVDRVAGVLTLATGAVNTQTSITSATNFNQINIRGAATQDGSAFYFSGGDGVSNTGGVKYAVANANTSASTTSITSTSATSATQVQVVNSGLYVGSNSAASPGRGIFKYGDVPTGPSSNFNLNLQANPSGGEPLRHHELLLRPPRERQHLPD